MVADVGSDASTCARCTASRTRRAGRRPAALGHPARLHREMLTGLEDRGRAGPLDGDRDRLVGGRLRPARRDRRAARQPLRHRDGRTDGVGEKVRGRGRRRRAVRRERPPAAAVQHDLPAGRRARDAAAPRRPDAAADPRPAHLLAHRRGRRRAHERLDHRAVRRAVRHVGHRPGRAAGPPGRGCCRRSATRATVVGPVRPVGRPRRWPASPVVAVGSHDTASAVVGVPAGDEPFAYISSGTWSLVGLELDAPVLSEDARLADFTNETGVDGTIRFLRNVMRALGAVGVRARVGRGPPGAARRGGGRASAAHRRRHRRRAVAAARRHAGPRGRARG